MDIRTMDAGELYMRCQFLENKLRETSFILAALVEQRGTILLERRFIQKVAHDNPNMKILIEDCPGMPSMLQIRKL